MFTTFLLDTSKGTLHVLTTILGHAKASSGYRREARSALRRARGPAQ
jgi:hypothetical protein